MKKLLLIFCFSPLLGIAQFNNFDGSTNMQYFIDTTIANNIWQIGNPQKILFNSAFSQPNALVTDTINNYPAGNYSVFQFRVDMNTLWMFPFFVINWRQKIDTELKFAGGWIEASYDTGTTWVNVFTDTVYKPEIVGATPIDTLNNGEVGFTGNDNIWQPMMLCWGNGTGTPPFPINNIMDIRFIFWSDSSAQSNLYEGWILDDFEAYATVIDNVAEKGSINEIIIYPNPAQKEINVELYLEKESSVIIRLHDLQGKHVKEINYSRRNAGKNIITVDIADLKSANQNLILNFIIDGKLYSQKLINIK